MGIRIFLLIEGCNILRVHRHKQKGTHVVCNYNIFDGPLTLVDHRR